MSSNSSTGVVINVNDLPHITAIELPVFTKKDSTAEGLLGGNTQIVKNLMSNASFLPLSLNEHDPIRAPLIGSSTSTCGILVKIRRKKRKPDEPNQTPHPASIEVIGNIKMAYRYDLPYDYHVMPSSTRTEHHLIEDSAVIEAIPRPFSRIHLNRFNTSLFFSSSEVEEGNGINVNSGEEEVKSSGIEESEQQCVTKKKKKTRSADEIAKLRSEKRRSMRTTNFIIKFGDAVPTEPEFTTFGM